MTASLLQLVAPLAAAAVTAFVLRVLLASAAARYLADHPNERSLHAAPVPRTGGIGVMCGTAAGAALIGTLAPIVGIALALAILSLVDDWRGLPVALRFGAHFVAAATLLALLAPPWPWWVVTVVAVAVVWMTNLYNFMDGSDGLAGGMTLFGFGAYALAAWLAGAPAFALLCAVLAASAGAFLFFNFHPAKVFLGDAGSIPLGFLAAALGIAGFTAALWPAWFPVLVFSPFIVDASVTLTRRLLAGERVWVAHRKHYYQRMVRIGWGHARVALAEYALMAALAAIGIALLSAASGAQAIAIAIVALFYAAIGVWFDRRWAARPASIGE